jgi:hypothetical protein
MTISNILIHGDRLISASGLSNGIISGLSSALTHFQAQPSAANDGRIQIWDLSSSLGTNNNIVISPFLMGIPARLPTLAASLKDFQSHTSNVSLQNFDCTSLEEDPQLTSSIVIWAEKLKEAKDFKDPRVCSLFSTRLLSVVQYSTQNPKYLKFFKKELVDVTSSCVDNASLGLNTLEMKKKIMQSSNGSFRTIFKLFKGDFSIKVLQECAVQKLVQCRENGIWVDDLEVELGFQVDLRERLNLPIECNDMNFRRCSALTDTDLDEAEKCVNDTLRTNRFRDFLMDQKIWIKTIEKNLSKDLAIKLDPIIEEMGELDEHREEISSEEYQTHSAYLKEKYDNVKKALLLEITEDAILVESPLVW